VRRTPLRVRILIYPCLRVPVTPRVRIGGCEMSRGDGTDGDPRNLLIELRLVPDADSEEAERFGRQLRAELAQLDVEAVSPMASADVAQGAKGAGIDWSSLLVTLNAAAGVITSVIAVVQDWLARHNAAQSIKVTIDGDTIELGRASVQEREELISAWVHRHSGA
jgi:membrane-associated two-gene conflict system component 1 (EACC1)